MNLDAANKTIFSDFNIFEEDLIHVQKLGVHILEAIENIVNEFHEIVGKQTHIIQIAHLQNDQVKSQQVKMWERKHWSIFWEGSFANEYFNSRNGIGINLAAQNLPLSDYTYSASVYLDLFINYLDKKGVVNNNNWRSIRKLYNMDTNIIIAEYSSYTNQVVTQHMEALKTMSFPVSQIWDKILLLPIVGKIDHINFEDMLSNILNRIVICNAKVLIVDLLGIKDFTPQNAHILMKLFKAAALMDCQVISSGIMPDVAEVLANMEDINLDDLFSSTSMEAALAYSFKLIEKN